MSKNEEDEIPEDDYNKPDEDDIIDEEPTILGDDDITEDNYRTTFEIEGEPDEEAESMSDFGDE